MSSMARDMINPPASAEVNADITVWICQAIEIPIDLHSQSSTTGHHFFDAKEMHHILCENQSNLRSIYSFSEGKTNNTQSHTWYSRGTAASTMGKINRFTNFVVKSLIVNAIAMVRANFMVKTANTLIQTVKDMKMIREMERHKSWMIDDTILSTCLYHLNNTYLCIMMQLHH